MGAVQGERAKTVARAVAAAGARAYVLRGGFKAWQAAGLKVREGATEYDASVADALADEVDVIAEQTIKVVGNLKVGGSSLAGYFVYFGLFRWVTASVSPF